MKKLLVLIWILSVSISFFIGYKTQSIFQEVQPQSNPQEPHILVGSELFVSATNDELDYNQHSNQTSKTRAENIPRRSIKEVLSEIKRLLAEGDSSFSIASLAESYSLIKRLTEDELNEALGLINFNSNTSANSMLMMTMMSRFAELNPQAALSFVEYNISNTGAKRNVLNNIIISWANTDPLSAYYWSLSNDEDFNDKYSSTLASIGTMAIFSGLAKQDLYDAFDKLSEIDTNDSKIHSAAIGISRALEFKEDFINFIEKVNYLENNNVKDSIIRAWSQKNPQEAADWLFSNAPTTDRNRMKNTLISTWLSSSPNEAADWYMNLVTDASDQEKLDKIINKWSSQNPEDVLDWINLQPEIDTDKSIVTLLNKSASINTKFAIDNLNLLSSDLDKQNVSFKIYRALKYSNKKKAEKFFEQSPYQSSLLQQIRKDEEARAARKSKRLNNN